MKSKKAHKVFNKIASKRWIRRAFDFSKKTEPGALGETKYYLRTRGDGKLIGNLGTAPVHGKPNKSYVYAAAVTPEWQRRGIGRFLYGKARYDSKKQGLTLVSSEDSNLGLTSDAAKAVWRKLNN